jgi:hypothetical protein
MGPKKLLGDERPCLRRVEVDRVAVGDDESMLLELARREGNKRRGRRAGARPLSFPGDELLAVVVVALEALDRHVWVPASLAGRRGREDPANR